jgi:hypothetical protein
MQFRQKRGNIMSILNRIKHTAQGAFIGCLITTAACAYGYTQTHSIKFSSTASNQPTEIVQAANDAVAMEKLMPDTAPMPGRKPKAP